MSILRESLALANGNEIPLIGLGTWQMSQEEAARTVEHALKNDYVHIDTARTYGNEEGVGKGMKASGVAREDYFLTTKVNGNSKTYEDDAGTDSIPNLDESKIDQPSSNNIKPDSKETDKIDIISQWLLKKPLKN